MVLVVASDLQLELFGVVGRDPLIRVFHSAGESAKRLGDLLEVLFDLPFPLNFLFD